MAATTSTCRVCHERIRQVGRDWVHEHSGDRECWTGDGSVAYPVPEVSG